LQEAPKFEPLAFELDKLSGTNNILLVKKTSMPKTGFLMLRYFGVPI
jgi:hypothetical protein